ncbi:methyltransferase domain-containing protein [Spirulina subsalsa FACHB-351]|uniref:Methyltransferase domain-containing protein n=1 Tax=Spirulina subsalsa FACHB-351 TaxID=234711 RepID=A0ABT3L803_9CYAN|nr:class I SAM-dependent methyltransferase [Spirulina subsalsa]MCW6037302.1 methyltransferase domain-containing protein [Spirulina subsalsa FACHB-351]
MQNLALNLRQILSKTKRKLRETLAESPEDIFPLCPPLPLPPGVSEEQLFQFLKTVLVSDAPPEEMANYCTQDFRRFVYTYGLTQNLSGECLELGANPYFTTFLLREFTPLKLTLANYFGQDFDSVITQTVNFDDFQSKQLESVQLESYHFNIEEDPFPFSDQQFDVVLFCEIIEHLLLDPASVLHEIKRILKPNGTLILTTPNVSRLENVAKMIGGANIYDPYSGYGPYGRHNREYNKHELYLLLTYLGFEIDSLFTADVHQNNAGSYASLSQLKPFLKARENDLGQYIFVRAKNAKEGHTKKPSFLYRSYPPEELE